MDDLGQRLAALRRHVQPRWTAERERQVKSRIDSVLPSVRRFYRTTLLVACVLAAVSLVTWQTVFRSPPLDARPLSVARLPRLSMPLLLLDDGTQVSATKPGTRLSELSVSDHAVSVRLVEGSARFEVTPNSRRTFTVSAADVTVSVLGTVFVVELDAQAVRVSVERGRVRVESRREQRELAAGESARFATGPLATGDAPQAPVPDAPSAALPRGAARPSEVRSTGSLPWQTLAADGAYDAAYRQLAHSKFQALRDEPGELLLAADVARLTAHAAEAANLLQRVLDQHGRDSRAPLAAFTLGRVLLDQLGQPERAARAFRSVRRLAPGGALEQDALAREVESLAKAGDSAEARLRGEEYLKRFPSGRRAASVRRFAGIGP
jgi:transmembrane sensor